MYGYVYKTTNLQNGKIYVGEHRGDFDPTYYGSGVILWKAINKYGMDSFKVEMLIPCFSLEELNAEESMIIDILDSRNPEVGYNIASGGDGGPGWIKGRPFSKSHKVHLSQSHLGNTRSLSSRIKQGNSIRGESNCNYGKPMSLEVRAKLSKARKGSHHSEESKQKISVALSGKNNPFYGKTHTPETRAKISEASKNRKCHLICKKCGKQFISRSSRTKYCDVCGGRSDE